MYLHHFDGEHSVVPFKELWLYIKTFSLPLLSSGSWKFKTFILRGAKSVLKHAIYLLICFVECHTFCVQIQQHHAILISGVIQGSLPASRLMGVLTSLNFWTDLLPASLWNLWYPHSPTHKHCSAQKAVAENQDCPYQQLLVFFWISKCRYLETVVEDECG